jgi:hypothetical protein
MIPSYNAADLRYPSKDLYLNWSNDYLCGKTPLDFVYVPTSNQFHAERNPTNLQYFENEIKCSVSSLPTFIGDLIMPASICTTTTAFVDQCKTNTSYTYTWTSSNTNVLQIVGTGRQVTLNKAGNGTVTVSVNIAGCGLNVTRQKIVTVGAPSTMQANYNSPTNSSQPAVASVRANINWNDACIGSVTTVIASIPPGSTINWFGVPSPSSVTWYQSGNNVVFNFTGEQQTIALTATVSNSCGNKSITFQFRSANGPSCGSYAFKVNMSPNPASSQLIIAVDVQSMLQAGITNNSLMQIKEIKIYDKLGVLKKINQFTTVTQTTNIPVNDLPNDLYFVHISNGMQTVIKQIIIQR